MNNTLVKGLQLLELLARHDGALGVSELASRLALGKSNVHRLLQALVELGYVRKNDPQGSYEASLKVWEIGTALASRLGVKAAAIEAMDQLLQTTRETVHLSVLDGDEVVYLHKLDSPEPVRAYSEIGGRAPVHCVATGKAILAWQPEAYIAGIAGRLRRHTPKTITDPDELRRDLQRVRSNGFAVNRGEWRETVWGVASPIHDGRGTVVAAIGVSGPSSRIRPGQVRELAVRVVAAAAAVTAKVTGN